MLDDKEIGMSTENRALDRRSFLKYSALGAAAIGGLAGCSASASGGAKGAKGKTKITMMGLFWVPPGIKAAKELVADFNAQSSTVEVEYVQSSWATIASKMTVAFSSGDVPDVFQYYDAGLVPWGQNGLLTDMRKVLPSSILSDINPGVLKAVTSPEHGVLGLPFESETPLIFYNTEMLKAAGIEAASAGDPWTWDQLRENARKLTRGNVYGLSAYYSSTIILFKNGLGWQAGAKPINFENGKPTITASDDGDRNAIDYLQSIIADGSADPAGFAGDPVASFASGKSAMLILGAWARTLIPTYKGANNIKWAAMPFTTGVLPNLGSGAPQTLSIPKSSKNQEAAAEFIAFWAQHKNVASLCQREGQIPPSLTALDILTKQVGTTDYWPEALMRAKDLEGQPYCPGWLPMLSKDWDPGMFKVLKGQASYASFANTVATQGTADVQAAAA
jgi:ABC-type glycerol-3-phosphate transport system substrate-binding protein